VETRSRLTILGGMAMPPKIIQLHVLVRGIGHLQVVHTLLISYKICVGFYSGGVGGDEILSYNIGRYGHASQYYSTNCFGPGYWPSSGCSQVIN